MSLRGSCQYWGYMSACCLVHLLHGGFSGPDLPHPPAAGAFSQPPFLSLFLGDPLSFIRIVAYRNLAILPVAVQTEETISLQITSVHWDAFWGL